MKENSALFMKGLVDKGIAYKHQVTRTENIYIFSFSVEQTVGRVNVCLFDDDNGLRITVDDFFNLDYDTQDDVLDIINSAPERIYATIFIAGNEVVVRKEMTTAGCFNVDTVFNTIEQMMLCADSLLGKLELLYTVLS